MRIGSSTLNQSKTMSKKNTIKGIIPNNFKNFNPSITEEFEVLNAWDPLSGTWTTNGTTLSTSTSSSSYPLLTSFDLRSQNITATMSLNSAGAGIAFWVQDPGNWWAALPFYTQGSEPYTTGTYESDPCTVIGCWAYYCNYAYNGKTFVWTCRCLENTRCTTYYSTGNRTRYNFYLKLLSSVNGTVSDITNILLRSTANATSSFSPATVSSEDNLNGIELTTNENIITIRGRDDSNSFYGSSISYTAVSPNRGYKSGIIFAPGGDYLLSSAVNSISIVGS